MPTLRNRTSALFAGLLALLPLAAPASQPSVATLDADARSGGNRKEIAEKIGDLIFAVEWPAQVMKIVANAADGSLVVGVKVSGVKFHQPLSRAEFGHEMATLAADIFAAENRVTEVDIWAAVPLDVGKGVIVSGDLATPTTRSVFTASILRGESEAALEARFKSGRGIYWDEEWVRTTLNGAR